MIFTSHKFKFFIVKIPSQVPPGDFNFVAEAVGNVNFNVTHSVDVNRKTHSLFIQTDKYLYKPGQTGFKKIVLILCHF